MSELGEPLDFKGLRHFLAVVDRGGVQQAADYLALTQPAITKSLARFQERLGLRLLERRGRSLHLTDAGQRFETRARMLVRLADDVVDEANAWRSGQRGDLVIGAGPVVQVSLLPQAIAQFLQLSPSVGVRIVSGHTAQFIPDLLDGKLHFAVTDFEQRAMHPELAVRVLTKDRPAAGLRPAHPLLRGRPPGTVLPLAELAAYPLAGATLPERFQAFFEAKSEQLGQARLSLSLTCDNYDVLLATMAETDCVVLAPQRLLERYRDRHSLALHPLEGDLPLSTPSLLTRRSRSLPPSAERLIECITGLL